MQIPENAILPAVLLDAENRQLASGEAQFLFCENRGWFRPTHIVAPTILDNLVKTAAIVRMSDGQTVKIQNLHLCPGILSGIHFDFELLVS